MEPARRPVGSGSCRGQRRASSVGEREFHEWVRLTFDTETGRAELLVSFHGLGRDYRGVIGVSACLYRRQSAEDIESQIVELEVVCEEVFQITYNDQKDSVGRRFRPWLEEALLRGLDLWRRGE